MELMTRQEGAEEKGQEITGSQKLRGQHIKGWKKLKPDRITPDAHTQRVNRVQCEPGLGLWP